jgi:hypothetical protein
MQPLFPGRPAHDGMQRVDEQARQQKAGGPAPPFVQKGLGKPSMAPREAVGAAEPARHREVQA